MGMFKYKEKRYSKLTFILIAVIFVLIAAACVYGGIYAVVNMSHWSKYIIVAITSLIGLCLGCIGIVMIGLSFSMINSNKSVRDGNEAIGINGTRLCDKCGRVITEQAEFCEHCGEKQQNTSAKVCPSCKAKNSSTAAFCEKCGKQL